MKRMKVAQVGLTFDPEKKLNELTFNLPSDSKILSVSATTTDNDEHVVWFTDLVPAEAYENPVLTDYPWKAFHFFIVQCQYTDINISNHKYIGNIDINGSTYAVFYKVGKIINEY